MSQPQQAFKWVGTRPVRPDGVPKVTGAAKFGADYHLPGMLYGKVAAQPPRACPHPVHRHLARAEALPGVKAVMTGADLPDHPFEYVGPERLAVNFWHVTRNIMAREKALYEGHAVAAVAATGASVASRALALIDVDYEVLPHVIDVEEAMAEDAPLLFEDMITRGVEPAPERPSNVSKRGRLRDRRSRRGGSPRPTRSSRGTTGPRPSTRRTSSRRRASRTGRAAARRSSGAPARGTSRCAA